MQLHFVTHAVNEYNFFCFSLIFEAHIFEETKKKAVRGDPDSDSDESSAATAIAEQQECSAGDDILTNIDQLTEKKFVFKLLVIRITSFSLFSRASLRKAGLEGICKFLARNYDPENLEGHGETLVHTLLGMVKKGDESELALRCLALYFISVGTDGFELYEDTTAKLQNMCKGRSSSSGFVRTLEVVGLLCFTTNQDRGEVINLMRFYESRFTSSSPSEADAALSSWGLLVTMLSLSYVSQQLHSWFSLLSPLLEHSDMDVRSSAGECLAIIFSAHYAHSDDLVGLFLSPSLPLFFTRRIRILRRLRRSCPTQLRCSQKFGDSFHFLVNLLRRQTEPSSEASLEIL